MPKRILIAGHEIGGQMQLLVETMRKRGIEATSLALNDDFRGFSNDIKINGRHTFSRFLFFLWALKHYDVFHFFWGVSLFSIWRFHLLDLPVLKIMNKKIIIHFRGTDAINLNYYNNLSAPYEGREIDSQIPRSRPDQIAKIRKWEKYADELLISTPDLSFVSQRVRLSPQVIYMDEWKVEEGDNTVADEAGKPILIAHAPTRRNAKGTKFIVEAVENLQKRGYNIELSILETIPYKQIRAHMKACDIGIDQLLHGWYGKISVELMAMKKPVVCYINPDYGRYRPDLPIVSATPKTIEQELEKMILSKELRTSLGQRGLEYVQKYHDVEVVVDELLDLYGFEQLNFKREGQIEGAQTW